MEIVNKWQDKQNCPAMKTRPKVSRLNHDPFLRNSSTEPRNSQA